MKMKGKIIKFNVKWNECVEESSKAIIIDYRDGYHIRKSWSNKSKFIECPLVKVYWLRIPIDKPPSALRRMSIDWNMDPQYSFGFLDNKNNYVIDEWDEFKSEWYYLDIFEVVD